MGFGMMDIEWKEKRYNLKNAKVQHIIEIVKQSDEDEPYEAAS